MTKSIPAILRIRAAAVIMPILVAQVGVGLGIATGATSLVSSPLPALAAPPNVDVVDVNRNLSNVNATQGVTQFGGRVEAVAVAPPNGAAARAVFAASERGGLWKATMNAAGTALTSGWTHVDTLVGPKQFRDVRISTVDPNLVIATAVNDTHTSDNAGIWRSTNGGANWTQIGDGCNPPDAFKMEIEPGAKGSQVVYVTTLCGLDVSKNSGQTFTLSFPGAACCTPFFDVKAKALQVSVCGPGGFFQNENAGDPAFWRPADPKSPVADQAAHGPDKVVVNAGVPCSLALGPGQRVFVATSITLAKPPVSSPGCSNQLEESDFPTATTPAWNDLQVPTEPEANCRPVFVTVGPLPAGVTKDEIPPPDMASEAKPRPRHPTPRPTPVPPPSFDVYVGTSVRVVYAACNTSIKGLCRSGSASWFQYDTNIQHTDPAGLVIDPSLNQGCPFIEPGDGGVFLAPASSAWNPARHCGAVPPPAWSPANTGLFALDALSVQGTDYTAGTPHTDLYTGLQDNGLLWSSDGATSWNALFGGGGADAYGVWAPPSTTAGPTSLVWHQGNPSDVLQDPVAQVPDHVTELDWNSPEAHGFTQTTLLPPGTRPADSFGDNSAATGFSLAAPLSVPTGWAVVTPDRAAPQAGQADQRLWRLYITFDNGQTWQKEGAQFVDTPTEVQVAQLGKSFTVYILFNSTTLFEGATQLLLKFSGITQSTVSPNAVGQYIGNFPAKVAGDPVQVAGAQFFSVDPTDPSQLYAVEAQTSNIRPFEIIRSSDGGSTWTRNTALETAIARGGAFATSQQVTTIQYDPNSRAQIVGTVDAGIFYSFTDGVTWELMRGSDQLQNISGFYFSGRTRQIFVSSRGRGVWQVTPPPVTFISIKPGGGPISHTTPITITGQGLLPIKTLSYRIIPAGSNPPFTTVQGSSVTIQLSSQPDGTYTIESFVTDTGGNSSPVQDQQVTLVGTPTPQISPDQLDFGSVPIGTTSSPQALTITNPGPGSTPALNLQVLSFTAAPPDFSLAQDGCMGTILAEGSSCTVQVVYSPTTAGATHCEIVVTSGVVQVVNLFGSGAAPQVNLQVNPSSIDFGGVEELTSGQTRVVTVTEAGSATTHGAVVQLNQSGSQYVMANDSCTFAVVGPGGSCSVSVTFLPTTTGFMQATLTITIGSTTLSVPLQGTGVFPPVVASGSAVFFDSCLALDPSSTRCDLNIGTDPNNSLVQYVAPGSGVEIAYAGFPAQAQFDSEDPTQVIPAQYVFDDIQPSVGESFDVYTTGGNYAKVLVTSFGDGGGYFIDYTTWDGSQVGGPNIASFSVGQAIAGGSGQATTGECFNFDNGVMDCEGQDIDVFCPQFGCDLTPESGTGIADLGNMTDAQYAAVDESTLANASYSNTPFPQSGAPRDEVLAIRTSRGNYAKVQVLSAQDWIFNYTTYYAQP